MSEIEKQASEVRFLIRYITDYKSYPPQFGYFTAEDFREQYALDAYAKNVVMNGLIKGMREGRLEPYWRVECGQCKTINYVKEENLDEVATGSKIAEGVIPCTYCHNGLSVAVNASSSKSNLYFAFTEEFRSPDYFANTEIAKEEEEFEDLKKQRFIDRILPWRKKNS